MTRHRYAEWDAAYVLGALSSADRHDYEDHLAGCAECREAVAQLTGVPGLLSIVEPVEVLALDAPASTPAPGPDPGPAPEAALASVEGLRLRDEGRRHLNARGSGPAGRSRRWLAVAASLLVLAGAAGGGYALSEAQHTATNVISGPTRLAFSPVVPSSMTAVVDVVPAGDRTTITVECQYSSYDGGTSSGADYSVWAVSRDGKAALVTSWRALPGVIMRPSGSAPTPASQLVAIEIRRADSDQTIMRAALG